MLTFCPTTRAGARQLRAGVAVDLDGQAATESLRAATGLPVGEEADFAALGYAGVRALLSGPAEPRLVLAVEVDPDRVSVGDDPYGSVRVLGVRWTDVLALYADPPDVAGVVDAARRDLAGLGSAGDAGPVVLTVALAIPSVATVLHEVDPLWFDPAEPDALG